MTRPIKFRGMDIHGVWYYGLVSMPKCGKYAGGVFISNEGGMPLAFEVRPETVGEFTGRLDKNGAEIYEGDRWQHGVGGFIGIVEFIFSKWQFTKAPDSPAYSYPYFHSNAERGEVIGNIHDNPPEPTEKGN